MTLSLTCPCGCILQPAQVRCPACSRLQAASAPRWPWILAGVAMLLIGVGVGLALNAIKNADAPGKSARYDKEKEDLPPKEPDSPELPRDVLTLDAIPLPPADPPAELPLLLGPIESEPVRPPTPDPATKPAVPRPELKPARPSVQIVKVTPEEPKLGGPLTVELKGSHPDGKPVKLQYRGSPTAEWQPVPGDRLELTKIMVPLVFLETRAIDDKGNSSPVERRTWTIPIPAGKIDNVPAQLPRLVWKLKPGDSFLQELIVAQNPSFSVLGTMVQSPLRYSVVSRFLVEQAGPAGYVVAQRIEGARLLQADNLTTGLIGPALQRMPGTVFRVRLDPAMNVIGFAGGNPQMMVAGRNLPGGMGLQTASLMDLDGWREMAQATFFQPPGPVAPRTHWVRPMSHNWGPLGSWVGQTLFLYNGRNGATHQFSYGHRMAHVAPRGPGMAMPFQVAGAAFEALEAAGTIHFDETRGRVMAGEERFRVQGRISMNVLGQNASIDIQETQTFQFRILDVTR